MSVVLTTMLLMVLLSFLVMAVVALPQMREGKTVLTAGGAQSVDEARRRAASLARKGGKATPARLRPPVAWAESGSGPRHAR